MFDRCILLARDLADDTCSMHGSVWTQNGKSGRQVPLAINDSCQMKTKNNQRWIWSNLILANMSQK